MNAFIAPTPTPTAPAVSPEDGWRSIAEQLRAQMHRSLFDAYIRDSRVLRFDSTTLIVALPSLEACRWAESRLARIVQRQACGLVGSPVAVSFCCNTPPEAEAASTNKAPETEARPTRRATQSIRPELAQALAQSAAEKGAAPLQSTQKPTRSEQTGGEALPRARPHLEEADDASPLPAPVLDDVTRARLLDDQKEEEEDCSRLVIEEAAGTVEAALQQPGRILAFPRYELRHIAMVGPEAFFVRLAFLQERYLHTQTEGRGQPFETSVEALLRWAGVGRATLHRFKKGDATRGLPPAAGWFGIEQLAGSRRSGQNQQQPPCRYRLQQGIPLTPMDADRLRDLLEEAGIRARPLEALQTLLDRPAAEIFPNPPPAPDENQRRRPPTFQTVASVVQASMAGTKIEPGQRAALQDLTGRLADHLTMPHQTIHVSWYFLRQWLPLIGHDMAALILYVRAQGYYNPQSQELRDQIAIRGGYSELARVIGLKRDRTIADWLPNLFDRKEERAPAQESEKWQREQQRLAQAQARIGRFLQVAPGSRTKTSAGHYAFTLRVALDGEPLTPNDMALRDWAYTMLDACQRENVLEHFCAWATSPAVQARVGGAGSPEAERLEPSGSDGAGILGCSEIDGWGILAAREMTARESRLLDDDGWGILGDLLNDGAGILAHSEMTAGELFKGLIRLNTFWAAIPLDESTTNGTPPVTAQPARAEQTELTQPVVVAWDLPALCKQNGGINPYRERILAQEGSAQPFMSWLVYAYSSKGKGIEDPFGWALARVKESPGQTAGGVFARLSARPPRELVRLLQAQIQTGAPPADEDWRAAFRDVPAPRLKEMAQSLGVG
jgi:hypothetical protein